MDAAACSRDDVAHPGPHRSRSGHVAAVAPNIQPTCPGLLAFSPFLRSLFCVQEFSLRALIFTMAPAMVDPRMMSIHPRIRYNTIGGVNGPLVILENVSNLDQKIELIWTNYGFY